MAECGKGCMPECRYFTTGGCVSPFNCMYKIERESITTATSIPLNPNVTYTTDTDKDNEIARLQAENAALRERLGKAVDKELIAKELAEIFDCPCNFTPLDEEMQKYCGDDCIDDSEVCWQRFIEKTVKKRLAELGVEK